MFWILPSYQTWPSKYGAGSKTRAIGKGKGGGPNLGGKPFGPHFPGHPGGQVHSGQVQPGPHWHFFSASIF